MRAGRSWPEEDHCHPFFNVLVLSLPSELKRRGEGGEEAGRKEHAARAPGVACPRSVPLTLRVPGERGAVTVLGAAVQPWSFLPRSRADWREWSLFALCFLISSVEKKKSGKPELSL